MKAPSTPPPPSPLNDTNPIHSHTTTPTHAPQLLRPPPPPPPAAGGPNPGHHRLLLLIIIITTTTTTTRHRRHRSKCGRRATLHPPHHRRSIRIIIIIISSSSSSSRRRRRRDPSPPLPRPLSTGISVCRGGRRRGRAAATGAVGGAKSAVGGAGDAQGLGGGGAFLWVWSVWVGGGGGVFWMDVDLSCRCSAYNCQSPLNPLKHTHVFIHTHSQPIVTPTTQTLEPRLPNIQNSTCKK
jgi:hypothetical protein